MSLLKLTDELFIDLTDVSLITTGEKMERHSDWQADTYYKTIVIKFKDGRTELLKFDKHDAAALSNYKNILEKVNANYNRS
jgi:hypothetical protein